MSHSTIATSVPSGVPSVNLSKAYNTQSFHFINVLNVYYLIANQTNSNVLIFKPIKAQILKVESRVASDSDNLKRRNPNGLRDEIDRFE